MNRFEEIVLRWRSPYGPVDLRREEIGLLCEYVKAAEDVLFPEYLGGMIPKRERLQAARKKLGLAEE